MEKSNIQRKWKVIRFILFLSFLGLLFLNNSIALLDINNLPQERDDAVLVTTENRQKDLIFTINDPLTLLLERAWNIFIHPQNHPVRNTITWLIAIAFVAIFGFYQARKNFAQISLLNSIIAGVMSFIIIFTFSHCGVVNGGDKKGSPIWLANQNGVNSNTQSVSNSGGSGSGQGSLSNGVVPVNGMYFLHPDHLGSISMITDGHGNVVSGGTFGGKSNIVYKPYGEIDREKSSGPDITRFKYTGQEEDKETGLYYYKARYYDPMLGRFLQADSLVDSKRNFGMNRYMYVDGNPMRFVDSDGNEPNEGRMNKSINNLITFYFLIKPLKKMKEFHSPGYNYAGDGNTDRLSSFYTSNENNKNKSYLESTLLLLTLQNNLDPKESFLYTYIFAKYIGPELRPKPVSYMDWVSQKHDDESPNPLNHFRGKRDSQLQTRASFNFVLRAEVGLYTGKIRTPQDLAVYYLGTQLYFNYGILRGIEHLGQKAGEEIGKIRFNCKNCNVFGR